MKKIITLLIGLIFSITVLNSQDAPPQAFSYKATITKTLPNGNMVALANKTVGLKIIILRGDQGTPAYSETFTPTTNSSGQIDIVIGRNPDLGYDFSDIEWSEDKFFLQVWVDINGGTAYGTMPMSTTQLLSVPYALYAGEAGLAKSADYDNLSNLPVLFNGDYNALSNKPADGTKVGDMLYWNETAWVLVPVGLDRQILYLNNNIPTWGSLSSICINPTLSTTAVVNITQTSAEGGGNITSDGGCPVTAKGVCWALTANPTFFDNHTNDGPGTGTFTSNITGLTPGTLYYVRAYATNSRSTVYGQDVQFTTQIEETVEDYDHNIYNTVNIGAQTWMAENLKTTTLNDGTSIPLVERETQWHNLNIPAYCWYFNDATTYGAIHGALYNWYAVSSGKLCPTGWHVPNDMEWESLTNFLGGESVAGGKLKETGTTHWQSPNTGATNEMGFTALPSGYRDEDGFYHYIGGAGFWWSSSEASPLEAYFRVMFYGGGEILRKFFDKHYGLSVRCLKD